MSEQSVFLELCVKVRAAHAEEPGGATAIAARVLERAFERSLFGEADLVAQEQNGRVALALLRGATYGGIIDGAAFMKTLCATGMTCLVFAYSGTGSAGVSSRLVYSRGADVSTCPDEAALRKAVADRLGYDPFVAYARTTVVAEVLREGGRLKAHAQWVDEEGILRGSRDLASDNDDCSKLVAALALAVSIALDPMAAAPGSSDGDTVEPAPADDASSIDPVPTLPPADTEGKPLPSAAPRDVAPMRRQTRSSMRTWAAEVGARGFVATGSLPAISEGGAGFLRFIESQRASIALEGQFELPATADASAGPGRVAAWSWTTSLVPCWHLGPAGVCALGTLGEIRTHGEGVAVPRSETALYAAVGARALLGFHLIDTWRIELHGDISAPLIRNELSLNGTGVWRTPPVAGAFGAGIVGRVW